MLSDLTGVRDSVAQAVECAAAGYASWRICTQAAAFVAENHSSRLCREAKFHPPEGETQQSLLARARRCWAVGEDLRRAEITGRMHALRAAKDAMETLSQLDDTPESSLGRPGDSAEARFRR